MSPRRRGPATEEPRGIYLDAREEAIIYVAVAAMALDEGPFDIGEGLDLAQPTEVSKVADRFRNIRR